MLCALSGADFGTLPEVSARHTSIFRELTIQDTSRLIARAPASQEKYEGRGEGEKSCGKQKPRQEIRGLENRVLHFPKVETRFPQRIQNLLPLCLLMAYVWRV